MRISFLFLFFLYTVCCTAQPQTVATEIDALLNTPSSHPFNGVVLVSQGGKTLYKKAIGYRVPVFATPLQVNDRFLIASISKQITAVLVLRQYDKGKLNLGAPVKDYLPQLKQPWAEKVTIHQLLTHTHGIPDDMGDHLLFEPGTQSRYSNIGYVLLAQVLEATSGKSFDQLSAALFKKCGMEETSHPALNGNKPITPGFIEGKVNNAEGLEDKDKLHQAQADMAALAVMAAAGGFISTAPDLLMWNECLHGGRLLKPATYKMMMSAQPNAIRQHPVTGLSYYGYGITVTDKEMLLQLGQTGLLDRYGYVAIDYYFPSSQTSVIVLSNVIWGDDIKKMFYYHGAILNIVKEALKQQ